MASQLKRSKKLKEVDKYLFVTLLILVIILGYVNLTGMYKISLRGEGPIIVHESKIIDLGDMTLRQKIAQTLIVFGQENNIEDIRILNPGGVYIGAISASPEDEFSVHVVPTVNVVLNRPASSP